MAIVFISPKKKQRMFLAGSVAVLILFLITVALIVFLSQPSQEKVQLVFNKPKVNINFSMLESEEFKILEPFSKMELQFRYEARDEDGNPVAGLISAVSEKEAREILKLLKLDVFKVEEVGIGRENPFTPYFEVTFNISE